MKIIFLFLVALYPIVSIANHITLEEAIHNGSLKLVVSGTPARENVHGSSHTGKCLRMQVTNTGKQSTSLRIENAYRFGNEEKSHQDLMTCEAMTVQLQPQQTSTFMINALCCEKNDGAPSASDTFHLVRKESGTIERLCVLLERQKNFDNTAQQAMWCLTDNNPIENIVDTHPDLKIENELIAFIAKEKGVTIPVRLQVPVRILRYAIETEGKYSQWMDKPATIGIYITDSLNNILITLMPDERENRTKGTVKYSYGYRGLLPKGHYKLQAKIDGVWKKEKDIIIEGAN